MRIHIVVKMHRGLIGVAEHNGHLSGACAAELVLLPAEVLNSGGAIARECCERDTAMKCGARQMDVSAENLAHITMTGQQINKRLGLLQDPRVVHQP
ncbi:MAG: hypothetical protein AAFO58_03005 [Pseudomonadota bacterium]